MAALTAELLVLTDPGAPAARRGDAATSLRKRVADLRAPQTRRYDDGYDNSLEAFAAVDCTDAYHASEAMTWPMLADRADRRDPYFGRLWTWVSAPCARNSWTVRDEDAYLGPFNRRTAAPVLVVGNYWDPSTNYRGAVNAARLLPNSRLLSSDSWGHTAYGTSACATGAIDRYLLTGVPPASGTVCTGDVQPFAIPPTAAATARVTGPKDELAARGRPARGTPKALPPVVAPFPLTAAPR